MSESTCPECFATTNQRVLESKRRADGARRRRIHCKECGQRYTTYEGGADGYGRGHNRRKFSEEQVLAILASDKPSRALALEYDVHYNTIHNIKKGYKYPFIYRKFHGIGPAHALMCNQCMHWTTRCTFGFPDAGGTFAEECNFYQQDQVK